MTLFTVGFPIEFTLRVYDAFFAEGEKILFRVAIHLLKSEKRFLKCEMESFFSILKENIRNIDPEKFMEGACKVSITRDQIAKF